MTMLERVRRWLTGIGMPVLQRLGADSLVGRGLSAARATDPSTGSGQGAEWNLVSGGAGPADRPWTSIRQNLEDTLEAWRLNAWVRQVVRLVTAYVVGDGISVTSSRRTVARFVEEFWNHRQNRIGERLAAWCDELTRSGELFVALFPNPVDGMQYVRAIPASQISRVETDPEDYEKETGYLELVPGQPEPRRWKSPSTALPDEPCLLHFAINRPVGATRGESDLLPLLPWARRYTDWLRDRVKFNKIRSELAVAEIVLDDDTQVERKKAQYRAEPPTAGSIYIHGRGEELRFPAANIGAFEASGDGQALRLAMATSADIPLHFFSEGADANRATAVEMGDPTHRFYRQRQRDLGGFLVDLVAVAYVRRAMVLQRKAWGPWSERGMLSLGLSYQAPDISRADNKAMAEAARTIVEAFAVMADRGWITDKLAVRLAFRFAGEVLSDGEIEEILANGGGQIANSEEQTCRSPLGRAKGEEEEDDTGLCDGLGAAAPGPAWLDLPTTWR